MRESFKAVCGLLMIIAIVVTAFAWFDDRPNLGTWMFRFGAPLALVGIFVISRWIYYRVDKAPDYLYRHGGKYFDRDGFCFSVSVASQDRVCYFDLMFQNRYERPCIGQVALRPAKGLFGRRKIEAITYQIHCEPGAFGIARVPVPLPKKVQGKTQSFEVGASAHYPEGKGRTLRFRDGLFIRTNSDFGDSFSTGLTLAGLIVGVLVLSSPAMAKVTLPTDVMEDIPDGATPSGRTLWKLGDPPLV